MRLNGAACLNYLPRYDEVGKDAMIIFLIFCFGYVRSTARLAKSYMVTHGNISNAVI